MKKNIFFSAFLYFSFGIFVASAQECNFPAPKISADEIIAKIEECKTARTNNTTAQIEDFSCPAGEFALKDNLALSDERLAYHITVNLLMNQADENIKKYMQLLQKNRNKDALAWTENIRTCIYGSPKSQSKSIKDIYSEICNFSNIATLLNENSAKKTIIHTTESLPQVACQDLADRKIRAWELMGKNLMQSSIHKSYQNERHKFMDMVQGKYRAILEKFHDYQKIIFRSANKVGPYIRDAVK